MRKTMRLLWLCLLVVPLASASLDFLELTPAAGSRGEAADGVGAEAQIASLWGNPAALGQVGHRVSLLLATRTFGGLTLLTGGAALRSDSWVFAAGVSGLMLPQMKGDLQFSGDTGRELRGGDLLASGAIAFRLGEALGVPFIWNLGLTVKHAVEILDEKQIHATMLDAGLLLGFRLSPLFHLGFSADARHLVLAMSRLDASEAPSRGELGIRGEWTPSKSFGLGFRARGVWNPQDGVRPGAALEMIIFKVLALRASVDFALEPKFEVGCGVSIRLPGSTGLSLGLGQAPGQPGGDTRVQIAAGFGAPASK
jgi:hypothetical protein